MGALRNWGFAGKTGGLSIPPNIRLGAASVYAYHPASGRVLAQMSSQVCSISSLGETELQARRIIVSESCRLQCLTFHLFVEVPRSTRKIVLLVRKHQT